MTMVNIMDYGAVADGFTDDTAAYVAARAAGEHVYFPAGRYILNFYYASGVFSGAELLTSTTLSGDGALSIISPSPDNVFAALGCDSGGSSAFVTDITIRDLKFLGWVESDGHNQQAHLLFLSGVKRVVVERCMFEGAQGDAIVLASGAGGPSFERHNYDVIVRDSVFDGVLYGSVGGRNPISIIDGDDVLIDGNSFTRWGQDNMPGGIDMEPDMSFGIIRNVRITNNKFSLSGGNRGHVVVATDNISNANWKNILVSNNQFESAANAAVCIYSAATIATEKNGVTITNNTIDNCLYALQKVAGSVYGLVFAGNQCTSSVSGSGRIIIGNGTADYTIKDWLFADNVLTVGSTPIGFAIGDNSENVTIGGNLFRGATQAHIRAGQNSPSTTYTSWTIVNNAFLGTPTNGMVQGDGNTTATLNVFDNNRAPVGVSGAFRATRGDFLGNSGNYLLAAALPSTFPFGVSTIRLANDAVITANDSGWLITYKQSAHAGEAIWQEFVPFHSATMAHTRYMRKAIDASNWGTWSAAGPLKFAASLTPSSVAANTSVAEVFTVTGVRTGDVVSVTPPGHAAGVLVGAARVSASDTVRISFGNLTAGVLSPPAGSYRFSVTR